MKTLTEKIVDKNKNLLILNHSYNHENKRSSKAKQAERKVS